MTKLIQVVNNDVLIPKPLPWKRNAVPRQLALPAQPILSSEILEVSDECLHPVVVWDVQLMGNRLASVCHKNKGC